VICNVFDLTIYLVVLIVGLLVLFRILKMSLVVPEDLAAEARSAAAPLRCTICQKG
jgi:hypothetical protein